MTPPFVEKYARVAAQQLLATQSCTEDAVTKALEQFAKECVEYYLNKVEVYNVCRKCKELL